MMSGRVLGSQGNDGSTHTHTPSLMYFYSLTSKATPFSMFFSLGSEGAEHYNRYSGFFPTTGDMARSWSLCALVKSASKVIWTAQSLTGEIKDRHTPAEHGCGFAVMTLQLERSPPADLHLNALHCFPSIRFAGLPLRYLQKQSKLHLWNTSTNRRTLIDLSRQTGGVWSTDKKKKDKKKDDCLMGRGVRKPLRGFV